MVLKVEEVTDKIYTGKVWAKGGGCNGYDIHRTSVGLKVEDVTDKIYKDKCGANGGRGNG